MKYIYLGIVHVNFFVFYRVKIYSLVNNGKNTNLNDEFIRKLKYIEFENNDMKIITRVYSYLNK